MRKGFLYLLILTFSFILVAPKEKVNIATHFRTLPSFQSFLFLLFGFVILFIFHEAIHIFFVKLLGFKIRSMQFSLEDSFSFMIDTDGYSKIVALAPFIIISILLIVVLNFYPYLEVILLLFVHTCLSLTDIKVAICGDQHEQM